MKTREIQLTQGKVAIVDIDDYEWLNQWRWYAQKNKYTFYVVRNIKKPNGKRMLFYMHRLILTTPTGMDTDHKNGDGLDNRRSNLRICTRQENVQNQKLPKNNTSGYKGVVWCERYKQWEANIGINGNQTHLGFYDDINEAIAARQTKEIEVFGEFMRD